jgi:maltooligosyltrehalose trehalohydrolase
MSGPWKLERGATIAGENRVRFSVWAPSANNVRVRVGAGEDDYPLDSVGGGVFTGEVRGAGAGTDYRYLLDDGLPLPDPVSRFQPKGVHGPSRVVDPGTFNWTDQGWRGKEMADLSIYELHVGTFCDEGTFAGVSRHLAELRQLGVTAIEIMPVAQFPGSRNWGYDGVQPYAVQNSYGGPDELRRLVNAAHAAGLAVVLDVVYNHIGPEGNYLGNFGPYFTDQYRTPWGSAVNFDARGSDEVRRFVIDNALYWITEYHIDALRLDAIHGIFDFSARHVLAELAAAVHRQGEALGRRTLVIAESDLNDPRVIRPGERCGWGFDAQWSDDLHHAVHVALTDESKGYYSDFGGMASVAKALRDRFVYDGRFSTHRGRRHGAHARDVSADHFVVSVQNHDQVGNRANGDRLSTLVNFEQLKLAAAVLLLSPYVPMLFMGEEYGETNPFLYFVHHGDPELVEAVRRGRREEFAAFQWEGEVPDPQAEESFRRSILDRTRSALPRNSSILSLYRELLRLRREERLLRPGVADVRIDSDEGARWVMMHLDHGGSGLVAVFNFGGAPCVIPAPAGTRWSLVIATDAARFGSGSDGGSHSGAAEDSSFKTGAYSAALYRKEQD